jgi:RNA-binding protein
MSPQLIICSFASSVPPCYKKIVRTLKTVRAKETMTTMLTGKQKRHLRALGHKLKAVIQIGKKEIEESLIAETNAALDHHELIKVKLLESCMMGRDEASNVLAEACGADVAQTLGRTFLLYRPAATPVIVLPKAEKIVAAKSA